MAVMNFSVLAGKYDDNEINVKYSCEFYSLDQAIEAYIEQSDRVWYCLEVMINGQSYLLAGTNPLKKNPTVDLCTDIVLTIKQRALIRLYTVVNTLCSNYVYNRAVITNVCDGYNLSISNGSIIDGVKKPTLEELESFIDGVLYLFKING